MESAPFEGSVKAKADLLDDGTAKSRLERYASLAMPYVTAAKDTGKSILASLWDRKIAWFVVLIFACLFTPLLAKLSIAFKPLRWTAYFTLGVVILLIAVLTLNLLPTHVAFAYALGILVLFGCVDEKGALQGFSNKGPNTVAILYIVAFAVTRTNGMALVFRVLLGSKPLPLWQVLIRLCIPLGGLSVFLNNTRALPRSSGYLGASACLRLRNRYPLWCLQPSIRRRCPKCCVTATRRTLRPPSCLSRSPSPSSLAVLCL